MTRKNLMTRRHFNIIAEALRNARPIEAALPDDAQYGAAMAAWERACTEMAAALENTSIYYDRNRFLEACGVEGV